MISPIFTTAEIVTDRAEAEAQMTDTFAAFSPTAEPTTDADGMETPGWAPEALTNGKVQARSRQGDTNARTVSIGGVDRQVVEGGLHIPLDAPCPEIGWEYRCTAVGAASDPVLVGRKFRVVDVPAKSYATARRLDVVEV